jgi:AAA lid domain-containing protein
VVLAGRPGPVRRLLASHPALASRFPAVIDFPRYTAAQLAAIFATLAGEARFTLTPDVASKAATVLAGAEDRRCSSNARLAVRLLDQATASHAHRAAGTSTSRDRAALVTICATGLRGYLDPSDQFADDHRPGQYL